MLLGGIVLGLVAGLIAGGRLGNLLAIRLKWLPAIFLAVVVRFGTEAALLRDVPIGETLRVPLLVFAYAILLVALWANRRQPGLAIAFVGVLSNAVVIVVNGGMMPIWAPSLATAGLTPADVLSPIHYIMPPEIDASFLAHLGPLADVIPIPIPLVRNVASIGDVVISIGLGFFLFATVLRTPSQATEEARTAPELVPEQVPGIAGAARLHGVPPAGAGIAGGVRPETGLIGGLAEASILARPIMLGGPQASLTDGPGPLVAAEAGADGGPAVARPGVAQRIRRHPYVRLALDSSFSALWTGQLISLIGDRVHQVALAVVVYGRTHSAIAVGFVFLVATLPNLLFGPIAGTLVDRWDHREVMIVSDLLRAGIVLLIPIAAVTEPRARLPAGLPGHDDLDLLPAGEAGDPAPDRRPRATSSPANSALWVGETLRRHRRLRAGRAVRRPARARSSRWRSGSMRRHVRRLGRPHPDRRGPAAVRVGPRTVTARAAGRRAEFVRELREGWRFLRGDSVLLANTAQAVVGQFMLGIFLAHPHLCRRSIDPRLGLARPTAYSFIEGAIGAGTWSAASSSGSSERGWRSVGLVIVGYVRHRGGAGRASR